MDRLRASTNMLSARGLALLLSVVLFSPSGQSSPLDVDTLVASLTMDVTSFSEARFATTIRQSHDYSCGSAALATLLTHHYEHPVSEADIFQKMLESGNRELIRKSGFSLLDMKRFLQDAGFQSDGFRFTLDTLEKIGVPAIVLVNDDGYRHFVVIKGMDASHLLIGDPAKGTRYISRENFLHMWNGIVFIIRSHKNIASRHFNDVRDTVLAAKAPLDTVVDRDGITGFMVSLPGQSEF